MPTPRMNRRIPRMEATENLEPNAELRVTARNPDTGEEEVLIDTEEGIEPPEGVEIEALDEPPETDTEAGGT